MRCHTLCVIRELKSDKVQFPAKQRLNVGGQAAPPYPVSLQCGQHLLPQLDLPRHLVDAVAAAQERLQGFLGGGGQVAGVAGREKEVGGETGRWDEHGARTHKSLEAVVQV